MKRHEEMMAEDENRRLEGIKPLNEVVEKMISQPKADPPKASGRMVGISPYEFRCVYSRFNRPRHQPADLRREGSHLRSPGSPCGADGVTPLSLALPVLPTDLAPLLSSSWHRAQHPQCPHWKPLLDHRRLRLQQRNSSAQVISKRPSS
jgi:hypothetical protein